MVVDDELIVKYLAGEAGPDEAEALFDWMAIPENALYFEKIKATWNSTLPSKHFTPTNNAVAWIQVSDAIGNASSRTLVGKSRSMAFWYSVAAAVTVICIGAIFMIKRTTPVVVTTIASSVNVRSITLPDSSAITLNKNSSIAYSEAFDDKVRAVDFKGEAFFSVKGNAEKPFVIHTTVANIRVVGTRFNVDHTDDSVLVSVEEGRVLVYTSNDSTYLEAGQTAIVRSSPASIILRNRVDGNTWSYASRKFVFKETPLADVFASIEKSYPYSIKIDNPDIKNCKFTASFDHVSAGEILNLIGEALDLTVQQNENTFRVEGKGCPLVQ